MIWEQRQALTNKMGEVEYRRQLAEQQSSDDHTIIAEAHTKQEILAVMRQRMVQTEKDIKTLTATGTRITPYIEIGAERCQRSLILENEFGANGYALDISFEMLRYASVVAKALGYTKMPTRIACDAYNLPFQNDINGFTFCYQTLHHFPDPTPICKEIARVSKGDSTFFFDDEPVNGLIKKITRIYHRRGHRLSTFERLLDKAGLLSVVSKADDLEQEHHILEEEFDVPTWRRALSGFTDHKVVINKKLQIQINELGWGMRTLLAQLVGGNIRVISKVVKSKKSETKSDELLDILGCPNCKDKPKLIRLRTDDLQCRQCQTIYPKVDGVWLMFEKTLGQKLYPEYLS